MNNLESILSTLITVQHKLRLYHWNVKGVHFFTLHDKFEEAYDEYAKYIDDLAEVMIQNTEFVSLPLFDVLDLTTVPETSDLDMNAIAMVNDIISDQIQIVNDLMEYKEEHTEYPDVLDDLCSYLNKCNWMLNSFVKGSD